MDPEDKRLLEASASGQTDRVLQLLEEPSGQTLHKFKDQDGKTALHLAATNGHSDTVSALIMNGADISAQDFVSLFSLSHSVLRVIFTFNISNPNKIYIFETLMA